MVTFHEGPHTHARARERESEPTITLCLGTTTPEETSPAVVNAKRRNVQSVTHQRCRRRSIASAHPSSPSATKLELELELSAPPRCRALPRYQPTNLLLLRLTSASSISCGVEASRSVRRRRDLLPTSNKPLTSVNTHIQVQIHNKYISRCPDKGKKSFGLRVSIEMTSLKRNLDVSANLVAFLRCT